MKGRAYAQAYSIVQKIESRDLEKYLCHVQEKGFDPIGKGERRNEFFPCAASVMAGSWVRFHSKYGDLLRTQLSMLFESGPNGHYDPFDFEEGYLILAQACKDVLEERAADSTVETPTEEERCSDSSRGRVVYSEAPGLLPAP